MNRVLVVAGISLLSVVGSARTASAQYRPAGPPTTGETYHFEVQYAWWDADPDLTVNSEGLGIIGSDIDLINDLDIEKKRIRKLNLTVRPGKKHKFRFEYLPVTYEADTVLRRSFVFNGQVYNVGLPVQTVAQYKQSRFGYEWDFLYLKRGYAGVLLDVKYTDVDVELHSPLRSQPEFTKAVAPIPTIGFTGRGYLAPNISVTGEFSFFRVPDSIAKDFDGSYTDFDIYGTFNFTKNTGAQAGYRKVDVSYLVDLDQGTLKFSGLYFGGVLRF